MVFIEGKNMFGTYRISDMTPKKTTTTTPREIQGWRSMRTNPPR